MQVSIATEGTFLSRFRRPQGLIPRGAGSGSFTKAGCPTSRSFFARCGTPPMLTAQ